MAARPTTTARTGAPGLESLQAAAREAQRAWNQVPMRERLRIVRKIRSELASSALDLCKLFSPELERSAADSLTSEILPLAEACRFLELEAESLLKPKQPSRASRPLWLKGVQTEIHRDPLGVILVIGPSNYPLFLPCTQALQALVAGNAVLLKPGRQAFAITNAFRLIALSAGIPAELFFALDESPDTAIQAIRNGVDKVVLTGSLPSGEAVYQEAAQHLTPVVMELSGYDPVFVLASADLERSARAVAFGVKLNGGQTCIAPHRIYAHRSVADHFEIRLQAALEATGVTCDLLPVARFNDNDEAVAAASDCPFSLGATVFGEIGDAKKLASKINAGVVVINDMIVPTADPRLPFGGRKLSGFGTTRGAEGLLEFTAPKAIAVQRSKRLRHLETLPSNAEHLFSGYLGAAHRLGWRQRLASARSLMSAIVNRGRKDS